MSQVLQADEFILKSEKFPVFDVRTPAEFAHGSIPGAINLPLFTNEERAITGTIYKKEGRQNAILKGLEFIGPRMPEIIKNVERQTNSRTILVHCWRGGMRSGSVAWLLNLYGFKVFTLRGGYKAFRNWALRQFNEDRKVLVLGGRTGSAKTRILYELEALGEQIIDLEKLAHHKGSSFGNIGELEPPTQEQFENLLAVLWHKTNPDEYVWLEDESRTIGRKVLPEGIWQKIRNSRVFFLDIPMEIRVNYLVEEYGKFPKAELEESITRIKKRLGGLATQQALNALADGKLDITAEILLAYYDKTYMFGIEKRESSKVKYINPDNFDHAEIAKKIIEQKF